jgi:hypothetical protein
MPGQIAKPQEWEEDKANDKHQKGYQKGRSQVAIHTAGFGKKISPALPSQKPSRKTYLAELKIFYRKQPSKLTADLRP